MLLRWSFIACLALSPSAFAQNHQVSQLTSGNWKGGAYLDDKTNAFSYCAMSTKYNSGITVFFAIDNAHEWRIGFSSSQFRLRKGNTYTIAYTIDGASASTINGVARNEDYIVVELPAKSALFEQFRYGTMLATSINGSVHRFRLDGTSRALSILLDCANTNYATAGRGIDPPRTGSPPPAAPAQSSPTGRTISANDRLDATRFVANLFSSADFRDYRFMTSEELNDRKMPELVRNSDVAWVAPNAIGLLHIFSTAATSIDDQISSAMADDAKSCKGRFASGKMPDEENANFKQLFTVCDDKDNSFNIEYLFLPRKNGLAYRFGTMIFGRSDKAPENKGLREALKNASYNP